MRAIATLFVLMFTVSFASAEPAAFDFEGEHFVKKFDASKPPKCAEVDAEELSGIRQRAIKEMAAYEMGLVKAYFGK